MCVWVCGLNREGNPQGQRPIWCEISWEASNITHQPLTGTKTGHGQRWGSCGTVLVQLGQLSQRRETAFVWGLISWSRMQHLSVVLLFLTFPRSLIHLPLDPSTTRLCLLFHPWRRPTVFVCLFLTNPPAFTPSPSHLPHIFLRPVVSLSSISRCCRSVQVGARVVLSFSGFTHSRYYHQTPVSIADSHLDRAVNHLADNDGRCPLCQAWCPQMKACARHGLNKIIHISCWTIRWLLSRVSYISVPGIREWMLNIQT